jgi:hypothetical protein
MIKRLSIPATSITGVRLVCRACNAAIIIPIGAKDAPTKCFNCYADMPGPEIVRGLVRNLTWLQDTIKDVDVTFDAAVEGEGE